MIYNIDFIAANQAKEETADCCASCSPPFLYLVSKQKRLNAIFRILERLACVCPAYLGKIGNNALPKNISPIPYSITCTVKKNEIPKRMYVYPYRAFRRWL